MTTLPDKSFLVTPKAATGNERLELAIDPARSVLLENRYFTNDTLQWKTTFTDFVSVAGALWPI